MNLHGTVAVVTGAGNGIGAALAHRLAEAGVGAVTVCDLDAAAAGRVAEELAARGVRAMALRADVSQEAEVAAVVRATEETLGPVGLYCSNAGISTGTGLFGDDARWQQAWDVNVMAHVYAARALLPSVLRNGGGYFLATVSAAGLLTVPGDAPYSVTKHAALGFVEWLACSYSPRGLKVSALCPLGVWTNMLRDGIEQGHPSALAIAASGPIITAEEVADAAIQGIVEERFLILPHDHVGPLAIRKAMDPDSWISETAAAALAARAGHRSPPSPGPAGG